MAKTITKITDLIPDPSNYNKHSSYGMGLLEKSMRKDGFVEAGLISEDNVICSGNARQETAVNIGLEDVQIIDIDGTKPIYLRKKGLVSGTKEFKELALQLNAVGKANVVFDAELIEAELGVAVCEEWGVHNYTDEDLNQPDNSITNGTTEEIEKEVHKKLTESFIVPPFSILDTRQGYWIDRKTTWKTLINDKGESREETLAEGGIMSAINNGVSILDPVLAEIINLWFGLPNGNVFDCFAGDTVFGYVSAYLKNTFTGIELRQEQVDLNNERVKGFAAKYICDDGQNVLQHIEKDTQDLLFSCPPYFDLEVYSNLKNDASNQKEYADFIKILDNAFTGAIQCLKDNRFAVITVGDVRDKAGFYYRFVDDIKDIFKRNGVKLYNEMILVESIGTLPQRVGRFMQHRKIGKCHQNVLVFFKGDPKQIKTIYPKIENIEDGSADV